VIVASPSEHIWGLVCGAAEPARSNRPLMMLKAYIDDSRMGEPPVYTLGGWVAPASVWAPFSDAWRDILWMKPRIEYFKFDEALGLEGQFWGISEASRDEKLRLLINLIEEFDLLGLVSMIPHHIFHPLFGRHPQRHVRNPYILSFFGIIAKLVGHMSVTGHDEKVEFFFDYQPDSIKQVLEGWEEFKSCSPPQFRKFITEHPPNFLDDKDVVALQAADLHAGWARMRNEPAFRGEEAPEPLWGKERGKKIRSLIKIWDEQSCCTVFEEMFGFKPLKFSGSWLPVWRA
jgi:Protein of unknown function (DUF3800)